MRRRWAWAVAKAGRASEDGGEGRAGEERERANTDTIRRGASVYVLALSVCVTSCANDAPVYSYEYR